MSGLRNALALVLLVLALLFVAMNWSTLGQVQEVSLGVATVQVPLGHAMLVIVGLFALVFLMYALTVRTTSLVESRRLWRELEAARKLADQAEASRMADLRALVESGLAALEEAVAREAALTREHLDDSDRVLQAYLGEIDDFLKRAAGDDPAATGDG